MTLTIISREACGLLPPKEIEPMRVETVDRLVVHHTAEPPPQSPHSGHDAAHDFAAGMWRSIQAYYFNDRGYNDIAYHFGIAPDGVVYEGRHLDVLGAHALHCNTGTWGVVFMGVEMFTDAAEAAFRALWEHLETARGGPLTLEPHSECTATDCPGDTLRAWLLSGIRPGGDGPTPPPVPPDSSCAALEPGPPPNGLPLLRIGSAGRVVALVQQRLSELGRPPANSRTRTGGWDGIFGPATATAVSEIQMSHGLKVDGIVGRQMWCVLGVR